MVRHACMIILILTTLLMPLSAGTSALLHIVGIVQPQIHIDIHSRQTCEYANSGNSSDITTISSGSNYNGGYHLSVETLSGNFEAGYADNDVMEFTNPGTLMLIGGKLLYLGESLISVERDGYCRITVTAQ